MRSVIRRCSKCDHWSSAGNHKNRSWRIYGDAYWPCTPSLSRQTRVQAKYSTAEEGVVFGARRKLRAAEDMTWSSRI